MKRVMSMAVLAGAGGIIIRRVIQSSRRTSGEESQDRRWAVTINRPPQEVAPQGQWPEPLARLGDTVEVRTRPAPGGKGTELTARLRHRGPSTSGNATSRAKGETPQQALRSALRQAKQLIEVGEVLQVDPAPHGTRRRTPGGLLLEAATKRAGKEGVL
jgi:hypothetical protein